MRRNDAAGASGAPTGPGLLLRAALTVPLAVLVGTGCFLDRSGIVSAVPEETYHCSGRLHSASGELVPVDSAMTPFVGRLFLTHESCATRTAEQVTADWQRWVYDVVRGDPALAMRGPWCLEMAACAVEGPAPASPVCPSELPPDVFADCAAAARCLALLDDGGSPLPAVTGFDAQLDFGSTAAGSSVGPAGVVVRNTCGEPVHVAVDGQVASDQPPCLDDFLVDPGTCAPRDATEELVGRTLAAAGAPDAECRLTATFAPDEVRICVGRTEFSQDTVELYRVRFRGTGS